MEFKEHLIIRDKSGTILRPYITDGREPDAPPDRRPPPKKKETPEPPKK